MNNMKKTALEPSTSTIELRLRRLEDMESIRHLKTLYARLCDNQYEPDALAALFTEDAVWDGSQLGVHNGRHEIRAFFAGVSKQIQWAFHLMIAPDIEVDPSGETATGKWYLFEPCSMTRSDGSGSLEPVLMMAKYEDRYRKEGGAWKFSHVTVRYEAISNLDQGWVAQQFRS
jgi:ketosteroid isomerase-like protein